MLLDYWHNNEYFITEGGNINRNHRFCLLKHELVFKKKFNFDTNLYMMSKDIVKIVARGNIYIYTNIRFSLKSIKLSRYVLQQPVECQKLDILSSKQYIQISRSMVGSAPEIFFQWQKIITNLILTFYGHRGYINCLRDKCVVLCRLVTSHIEKNGQRLNTINLNKFWNDIMVFSSFIRFFSKMKKLLYANWYTTIGLILEHLMIVQPHVLQKKCSNILHISYIVNECFCTF